MQGQKMAADLMAAASYVSVDMAMAALDIVGAHRFLASANAYMLPGTAFAAVSWKKLLKTKEAEEVRRLPCTRVALNIVHTAKVPVQHGCKCGIKLDSRAGTEMGPRLCYDLLAHRLPILQHDQKSVHSNESSHHLRCWVSCTCVAQCDFAYQTPKTLPDVQYLAQMENAAAKHAIYMGMAWALAHAQLCRDCIPDGNKYLGFLNTCDP
jgi:hypothetical protein